MKWKLVIVIIVGLIICAAFAEYIGLFELPDAYAYVVLGEFLYKGRVIPVGPFSEKIPLTLFAPVYALLVYYIIKLRPMFTLTFIQLALLFFSGILEAFMLRKLFPKRWLVGSILFFILPFQLIYGVVFMSETLTTFFMTLYVAVLILPRNKSWQPGVLVLLASILTLTRYAMLPILLVTIVIWILRKPRTHAAILPAVVGLLFILIWVGLHVRLFGIPMLSTHTGRHIYNNVIVAGKLVPTDTKNPTVARFFSFVPPEALHYPWWETQRSFASAFYAGKITEIEVDRLFLGVSLAAIKEHPISYIAHLLRMAVITPNTAPYHVTMLAHLGFKEDCPGCESIFCRIEWFADVNCRVPHPSQFLNKLFGNWILLNKAMYPIFSSILFIFAMLGIIISFVRKNRLMIIVSIIFLFQHFFQSATEWVEGRFLLPLYPLYTLLIIQAMDFILHVVTNIIHSHRQRKQPEGV